MSKKSGTALIVGAGISGIRAALDLAETGYQVTLLDRAPHMGGILSQLDVQFPTNGCGMCRMLPLVERDAGSQFCLRKGLFHENIRIKLSTELISVAGEPGRFTVRLREREPWVDPERCVGCDLCTRVCPVSVPHDFNEGLTLRKAIYLPVPHAIPNPYIIDTVACTRCGACEAVCPTDAIRLSVHGRRKFRVLVVDDEPSVRDSLKEWLVDEGFTAETAESGPAALEMLAGEPFHLMLTDIKMPGMDGVTLLKEAKAAYPDLTVVMMTAYATVDTAVEAMKIGALDYFMKPFDPEAMLPVVVDIYEKLEAGRDGEMTVHTLILSGGTGYYDPGAGKRLFGYGTLPNVMTSLEFERLLSGTGPNGGRLVRPSDGRPIRRIAFLQCIGCRDLQADADYCSSVCCMFSIKEAMLAKAVGGAELDAAIFYMDMRTMGKSFQQYRDDAEKEKGIRFVRSRIHSLASPELEGPLHLRYISEAGTAREEPFDAVVLAVGQRPAPGTGHLAEALDLELNPWGFMSTRPFSQTETQRPGIFTGGAFSGLKDISDSVITASAAANAACRTIHSTGGSLGIESAEEMVLRDVSREPPHILAVICTCGDRLAAATEPERLKSALGRDPAVGKVMFLPRLCTAEGWDAVETAMKAGRANRLLLGACHPYLFTTRLRDLGRGTGLDPALMDVADLKLFSGGASPATRREQAPGKESETGPKFDAAALFMTLGRLKHMDPRRLAGTPVAQRGLVVGGGISGMTAALAIAGCGYPVELVEKSEALGGNLGWLTRTLEGNSPQPLLEETVSEVTHHPQITVHLETQVSGSYGEAGQFHTTLKGADGSTNNLIHGVTILATGGGEAGTSTYGHGRYPMVVTQKEFEVATAAPGFTLDGPEGMESVVMIQCAGCREAPRNYCSRVCCASALKHALFLKEKKPDLSIYILYRDMMTYGFTETFFTRARQAGVIFIQYDPKRKPEVLEGESPDTVRVKVQDPVLGRAVEIAADRVVLAAGIVPNLPADFANAFGVESDAHGFFKEADAKWRPVDALREGIFACGLVHSPRNIAESMATADAAAQRALRILCRRHLPVAKTTAYVRESLCSLCERCIEACPYGARMLHPDGRKVRVNTAMCQGCGACSSVCPNGASVLDGYTEKQMLAVIDAACGGG